MAKAKSGTLPEGEYFWLNFRDEVPFSIKGHSDPDPAETEALKARRIAYLDRNRSYLVNPEVTSFGYLRGLDIPPFSPDLLHKSIRFKRPAPTRAYHIFATIDYAGGQYSIVSEQWKAAIEDIEPDRHEFFPFDICFSDTTWRVYIFHTRQMAKIFPGGKVSLHDLCIPNTAKANRSDLAGRHWIEHYGLPFVFVSRALALKLLPLLPSQLDLIPVVAV